MKYCGSKDPGLSQYYLSNVEVSGLEDFLHPGLSPRLLKVLVVELLPVRN